MIAKLLKVMPDKSNRQIAAIVDCDHKTVAAVRAELEATGEIPQLEKTIGKDGKARKPAPDPHIKAIPDRAEARSEENRRRQAAAGNGAPPLAEKLDPTIDYLTRALSGASARATPVKAPSEISLTLDQLSALGRWILAVALELRKLGPAPPTASRHPAEPDAEPPNKH